MSAAHTPWQFEPATLVYKAKVTTEAGSIFLQASTARFGPMIAAAPDLLAVAVRAEDEAQERHDFDDLEACAMIDKAYEPEYLRRKALRAAIEKATTAVEHNSVGTSESE